MQPKLFCQSCTMPIDDAAYKGTEKDGSKSDLYCRYCYIDGAFTTPGITQDEMKSIVITQMQKQHIPESIIKHSVEMLPLLKRWRQ